jgi:hypothetical protein
MTSPNLGGETCVVAPSCRFVSVDNLGSGVSHSTDPKFFREYCEHFSERSYQVHLTCSPAYWHRLSGHCAREESTREFTRACLHT